VGKGAGWTNNEVVASTVIKDGAGGASIGGVVSDSVEVAHASGAAMAIAVLILCAITHPTIFSRGDPVDVVGIKNRYAFDA
jgi:hypothetical protein